MARTLGKLRLRRGVQLDVGRVQVRPGHHAGASCAAERAAAAAAGAALWPLVHARLWWLRVKLVPARAQGLSLIHISEPTRQP